MSFAFLAELISATNCASCFFCLCLFPSFSPSFPLLSLQPSLLPCLLFRPPLSPLHDRPLICMRWARVHTVGRWGLVCVCAVQGGKLRTKPVVIMRPQGHCQTGPYVYAIECVHLCVCMCVCVRPGNSGHDPLSPESTTSILQLLKPAGFHYHISGHANSQKNAHTFPRVPLGPARAIFSGS